MKKILSLLIVFTVLSSAASALDLFTELQASISKDGKLYTFRVVGDRETSAFSAYGIDVLAPDGSNQMLDQFDAFLPEGSEIDALYIEDVNFDGYADLRIMKYLPGGANVPYYFWLFDPSTGKFKEAKAFEVVMSPEVDSSRKLLLSRQRSSAAEYSTDFYKPQGDVPVLVRREERTYSGDGSSVLKVFEVDGNAGMKLIETKNLPAEH